MLKSNVKYTQGEVFVIQSMHHIYAMPHHCVFDLCSDKHVTPFMHQLLLKKGKGRIHLWDTAAKLHQSLHFSHICRVLERLVPTERNYDVRNRELPAVKISTGERETLAGGSWPFLCSVNGPQESETKFALLCTGFNFTIWYCPNFKEDALSCIDPKPKHSNGFCQSWIFAVINNDNNCQISQTLDDHPDSTQYPQIKSYVISNFQDPLVIWANTSIATCHQLLATKYWWECILLIKDIRRQVCPR